MVVGQDIFSSPPSITIPNRNAPSPDAPESNGQRYQER
jgi:hypothetical protein